MEGCEPVSTTDSKAKHNQEINPRIKMKYDSKSILKSMYRRILSAADNRMPNISPKKVGRDLKRIEVAKWKEAQRILAKERSSMRDESSLISCPAAIGKTTRKLLDMTVAELAEGVFLTSQWTIISPFLSESVCEEVKAKVIQNTLALTIDELTDVSLTSSWHILEPLLPEKIQMEVRIARDVRIEEMRAFAEQSFLEDELEVLEYRMRGQAYVPWKSAEVWTQMNA